MAQRFLELQDRRIGTRAFQFFLYLWKLSFYCTTRMARCQGYGYEIIELLIINKNILPYVQD